MEHDLAFLLDSPPANADASWVQVAKTGKFSDPRYGSFTITAQDFARWVKNFSSNVGHGELGLPVDVDHSPEKRGDTEAMGWVKQLERRGDALWARVEWNGEGKALIADRRYAYLSPSYSNDFKDESGKSHGTALVGIALTNRPFLQMATVNLSQFMFAKDGGDNQGLSADEVTDLDDMDFDQDDGDGNSPSAPDEYTDGHALDDTMLDISDTARQKHAVVVKKIDGQTKHMFPIPPGDRGHARASLQLLPRAIKAGHITSQEAAAIRQRAAGVLGTGGAKQHSREWQDAMTYLERRFPNEYKRGAYILDQMELDQILNAMGLSRDDLEVAADAEDSVVLEALKKRSEKPAPADDQVILSKDAVTQLQSQAAQGAAAAEQLRISKFEDAFTLALSDGKLVPAQKDSFREMYDLNGDKTITLMQGLQPVVNMTPQGAGGAPADLDPDARRLAADYHDDAQPTMGTDATGLKVLARAEQLEREANGTLTFANALARAETELGVAA